MTFKNIDTWEVGSMICLMVKDNSIGVMELFIKEIS